MALSDCKECDGTGLVAGSQSHFRCPVCPPADTPDEALIRQLVEALDEATTYTSSPAWSPSMTRDCQEAITAGRARLGGGPVPTQPAIDPTTIAACIARLEQGGQSAAVSILRHHFEQKGGST